MALFMELKSVNPKLKQKEIAKELGYSSSALQRYRNDIKMQIFINQTIPKDLLRLQMTSKNTNEKAKEVKSKKKHLGGGGPNDSSTRGNSDWTNLFFPRNGWIQRNLKKTIQRFKTRYHKPLKNTTKYHFQPNRKQARMLYFKIKSLIKQ